MEDQKPLLLYHANCPDGFGATLPFHLKYGDSIEYVAVTHKQKPFHGLSQKMFKDRIVWMIDISFVRKDTLRIKKLAKEFINIDHHLGNQQKLGDLEYCHFDMNHSGAVLSWKYCFPEQPVPKLLQYIEDRDINNWNLPYAKELLSSIDAHEKTFDIWEALMRRLEDPVGFSELLEEGAVIYHYNHTLMEIIKKGIYYTDIKGYRVPIINTPFFRNEILTELTREHPFAAGYHYDGESFIFSLRSTDKGVNTLEIASQFPGGGGHRNASGFSVKSLDDLK